MVDPANTFLMSSLAQPIQAPASRGDRADDHHRRTGGFRLHEDGMAARHEVHAGGDHGRRVDQGGDRSRTLHGVQQPGLQRHLRGLAAGPQQQQQAKVAIVVPMRSAPALTSTRRRIQTWPASA